MTSPSPPVLEKGAHSAPTITTFSLSLSQSATTLSEERGCFERWCGTRLATAAARRKEREGEKEGEARAARRCILTGAGAACVAMLLLCPAAGGVRAREGEHIVTSAYRSQIPTKRFRVELDSMQVVTGWLDKK
jgi:hypothetical protein